MKPLTPEEIDLLFATTKDVTDAMQRSLDEFRSVADSLQAVRPVNGVAADES